MKRRDVNAFLHKLREDKDYYQKDIDGFNLPFFTISNELSLFIFYDALIKYKIILDDDSLLDEYIEQIDKLYKKVDSFDKIEVGINQLICHMVCEKLNYVQLKDDNSKRKVIEFIYKRYIEDGYYVHGFSSVYKESILKNGFIPEDYYNYYDDFSKVNKIFSKYGVNDLIEKDFSQKKVTFTDSYILGCYYSSYSPMYFYELLCNESVYGKKIRKISYLQDRFSSIINPLKRFISNNMFSELDKKYIIDLVKKEWDFLDKDNSSVSLLFVKRKKFESFNQNLDDYLDDSSDVYEIVDRILNYKNNNLILDNKLASDDFIIMTLPKYYEREKNIDVDRDLKEEIQKDFLNKYGNVSFLLLLGSMFISLGVFITIMMIIGGIL